MHTSISKRLLAGLLSVVMVLSLIAVAPVAGNSAEAATKPSITGYTKMAVEKNNAFTIKNLKKTQYAKISVTGDAKDAVTVTINGNKVTSSTKILGKGTNRTIRVKADKSAAGKSFTLNMKIYSRKTSKLVYKSAAKHTVTLKKVAATGIKLDKTEVTVKEGATETVVATLEPANATDEIVWTTSDAAVATVANGVITGVKAGTATVTATAGEFKAEVKVTVNGDTATAVEAAVVGVKKVQLTFNGAVDEKKASIVIKRGSITVNADTVKFDGNVATVTTVTNLMKGDYVVTVSGLTAEPFTATFSVLKDEAATTIKILTPTAPMTANPSDTAYVQFAVYNQYGEPMRLNAGDIKWSCSTGNVPSMPDWGVLELKSAGMNFVPGDKVTIYGVYATENSNIVFNETVTIGMASKADKVEVIGIYDSKTDKMVDSLPYSFADSRYALLFNLVDQYGYPYEVAGDVSVISTNTAVVDVSLVGYAPELEAHVVALVPGLNVAMGGTVDIQFISNMTGSRAQYTVTVAETPVLSKLTIYAPEESIIALDEIVEVNYEAYDQFGNAINSYDVLTAGTSTTPNLQWRHDAKGVAHLYVEAQNLGMNYANATVIGKGSYTAINFDVKAAAVPTVVLGLKKDVASKIAVNGAVSLDYKKLSIADQYGRQMSNAAVKAWLDTAGNSIVASTTDTLVIDATTGNMKTGLTLKALKRGTAKFVFGLAVDDEIITTSAKTVAFTVVGEQDFKDYEIADLGMMYDQTASYDVGVAAAYAVPVLVYGITADGTKVVLPMDDTYYTITASGISHATFEDGMIAQTDKELVTYASGKTEATRTVRVQVNGANGNVLKSVDKALTISSVAPIATTYEFETAYVAESDGAYYAQLDIASASSVSADAIADMLVYAYDQYGMDVATLAGAKFTVTGFKPANGEKVIGNGTAETSFDKLAVGTEFVLTIEAGAFKVAINVVVVDEDETL